MIGIDGSVFFQFGIKVIFGFKTQSKQVRKPVFGPRYDMGYHFAFMVFCVILFYLRAEEGYAGAHKKAALQGG